MKGLKQKNRFVPVLDALEKRDLLATSLIAATNPAQLFSAPIQQPAHVISLPIHTVQVSYTTASLTNAPPTAALQPRRPLVTTGFGDLGDTGESPARGFTKPGRGGTVASSPATSDAGGGSPTSGPRPDEPGEEHYHPGFGDLGDTGQSPARGFTKPGRGGTVANSPATGGLVNLGGNAKPLSQVPSTLSATPAIKVPASVPRPATQATTALTKAQDAVSNPKGVAMTTKAGPPKRPANTVKGPGPLGAVAKVVSQTASSRLRFGR